MRDEPIFNKNKEKARQTKIKTIQRMQLGLKVEVETDEGSARKKLSLTCLSPIHTLTAERSVRVYK